MTDELIRLAERVEQLSGPDQETDALIWAAMDGRDVRWQGNLLLGKSRRPPHDECRIGSIDPGKVQRNFSPAWMQPKMPAYTASLDSAMTLVPELWTAWEIRSRGNKTRFAADLSRLTECDAGEDWEHGRGATPALALTAASLRAIASSGGN